MFHVGDLVVCVCEMASGQPMHVAHTVAITLGRVLTIREIDMGQTGLCLYFEEVRNTPRKWSDRFGEAAYLASRFRPVRPQSIEWAREIARDVKQPQRENV